MLDTNETVIAIHSLLSLRGFDRDCRFYQEDNKMQRQPVPWVIDGRLNMELVDYAADILGATSNELLEMKGSVMERWSKKYPLVKYWESMRRSVNESYLRNPTPEERLLAAVYNFTERDIYVTRYDLKKLEERAMEALTALEAKKLGTIHPGEKIENFYADTVYICRYPHITEMVDSFFKMVNRGKELFFKALEQELTEAEICEYNLIVSYTGIRDKHFNFHGLYYRYLVKFRQLYLAEKGKDFFDYVVLSKRWSRTQASWIRCWWKTATLLPYQGICTMRSLRSSPEGMQGKVPPSRLLLASHATQVNTHCRSGWYAVNAEQCTEGASGSVTVPRRSCGGV